MVTKVGEIKEPMKDLRIDKLISVLGLLPTLLCSSTRLFNRSKSDLFSVPNLLYIFDISDSIWKSESCFPSFTARDNTSCGYINVQMLAI